MDAQTLHFREMFWDTDLMQETEGLTITMHEPKPDNIAILCDRPWEGNTSGYFQVFRDGPIYRMYYRGAGDFRDAQGRRFGANPGRFCYAESRDGVTFTRPELGLVDFMGSRRNNILFEKEMDNIFIFRDDNPDCPPEARYKGLCGEYKEGLMLYTSPDGIHFRDQAQKVIEKGHFDSLNTCFWNPVKGRYDLYYRSLHPPVSPDNPERNVEKHVRDIRHAVSPDFIHWTEEGPIVYGDGAPDFQMYTNNVMPYPRAPHMLVGWPARYIERRMDRGSVVSLPDWPLRRGLIEDEGRSGTAVSDSMLMTSRDGQTFRRDEEAFLRPGPERPGTWAYGCHYMAYGMAFTRNSLSGGEEISLYAIENYRTAPSALRRFTLRQDGFRSLRAPWRVGRALTKPVMLRGDALSLNFATSAQGYVRLRVCDPAGKPLEGFDSGFLFGDSLDRAVTFEGSLKVCRDTPVRLEFMMSDADLYSMTNRDNVPEHMRQ